MFYIQKVRGIVIFIDYSLYFMETFLIEFGYVYCEVGYIFDFGGKIKNRVLSANLIPIKVASNN